MKRITIETAKLAKKVGYRLPCDVAYADYVEESLKEFEHADNIYGRDGVHYTNDSYISYTMNPDTGEFDIEHIYYKYPALYQAELQEWLRNEHNIHINVDWFCSNPSEWDYQVSKIGDEDTSGATLYLVDWVKDRNFDSYEDAFEAGLVEALNLLIKKQ